MSTKWPDQYVLTEIVRNRAMHKRGWCDAFADISYDPCSNAYLFRVSINGKLARREGPTIDNFGQLADSMIDELWPLELL